MRLYPSQPLSIPLQVPRAQLVELLNQRLAAAVRLPWRFRLRGKATDLRIHLWCGVPLIPLSPRFVGAVSADQTHLTGSIEVGIRPWLLLGALGIATFTLMALASEGILVAALLCLAGTLALPPLLIALVWAVWHSEQDCVDYLTEMLRACAVGAGV
jgi:hypothetical protein